MYSIYAMKWSKEKLIAIGYNSVAVYETFYMGNDKEKVVEVFDIKKHAKLTMEIVRSNKPMKSIKMMRMFFL